MDHDDHVNLLRDGISGLGGVWADFGSGKGAFTLALADLIGPSGMIYSIDRDQGALRQQEHALRSRYPQVNVNYQVADYTQKLALPPLDGVVMANSLHFQSDQVSAMRSVRSYLKPDGRLLIVEYNAEGGNVWVPYPVPYSALERLAVNAGFKGVRLLTTRPSRFHKEIYSAYCKNLV